MLNLLVHHVTSRLYNVKHCFRRDEVYLHTQLRNITWRNAPYPQLWLRIMLVPYGSVYVLRTKIHIPGSWLVSNRAKRNAKCSWNTTKEYGQTRHWNAVKHRATLYLAHIRDTEILCCMLQFSDPSQVPLLKKKNFKKKVHKQHAIFFVSCI